MLNLDTHMLILAFRGDLTSTERRILGSDPWGVSAIAQWELAKLNSIGRIELDLDDPDVKTALSAVHVWPITAEIARLSNQLDFAGDPADLLIAATSIVHNVPLVTRDAVILQSELVPLARGNWQAASGKQQAASGN
jgi:PIN domain nuclease of toxin-antitoxin system